MPPDPREPRRGLQVVVLTPEACVLDESVQSLRIPVDTGQVGLRPGCEESVLSLEPGLVWLRRDRRIRYVATAGGIVRCDGAKALLLTPLAVRGDDAPQVLERLNEALSDGSPELAIRRAIQRLETGVLLELREPATGGRPPRPERP